MSSHPTAIVGGSGFTGTELAELVLRHPSLRLTQVSSNSLAGTRVTASLPRLRTDLTFCDHDDVRGVECAFLCLPAGASAPIARRLLEEGTRVVDLSPDFRLTAETYDRWYGPHPYPDMLPVVYGLPELRREWIIDAELVANPGCYPTAALLALHPLRRLGLREVIIDAKSGVSGAGKTPSERTHFCTVADEIAAYAVGDHRHHPEIEAGLTPPGSQSGPRLLFVPHLVPLQRGILETIYARLVDTPSAEQLRDHYRETYSDEPFVTLGEAPPRLSEVTRTNRCRLWLKVDEASGWVVLIAAIDNLVKGAAGQAVQNMNLMLGLPEQEGLVR